MGGRDGDAVGDPHSRYMYPDFVITDSSQTQYLSVGEDRTQLCYYLVPT